METEQAAEVRCECGKILAQRDLSPACLMVRNTLHKIDVHLTPTCMTIRGRCPGCSKLHCLTFPAMEAEKPAKHRRPVVMEGQLSLF